MNMPILPQFAEKQKTMGTRVIAELCEKEHFHVKRDCEVMFTSLNLDASKFGGIYLDSMNRQQTEYLLDEELTMTLVTGYNIVLRNRVIKRWKELELQASQPSYMIADPIERAKKWIEEEKQKQLVIQERDHAIATKAEIGSRREATAMATASKYKRKAEKLEVLVGESQSFATIKKVQALTGGTYDTYELRRYSKTNRLEIQKAEDANYGSVNSYHKDAWLAVYNINLSSIRGGAA